MRGTSSDKAAIRSEVLARRRSTPFDADAAARHVLAIIDAGALVASYSALPSEPSTRLLPAWALPRLRADLDLDLVPVRANEPLRLGPRGTTEPPGADVPWSGADLLVVPALAVARNGVRLGRGGGSYDRALTRVRPGVPVIALLALDDEFVDHLPTEPHDTRVTHVARPAGLEEVRRAER